MMKNKLPHNRVEIFAEKVTNWVGSPSSLVVHTFLFVVSFILYFFGFDLDKILLTVTTIVSLEAIYLAIFIQMSLNRTARSLQIVEENIDEIQEDVDEITKDIDEIQEDVGEITEDIDEIQEDVGEITEDLDEMQEDDQLVIEKSKTNEVVLDKIRDDLERMIKEIERIKQKK